MMEEYIDAGELSLRIKDKKQTVYNRVYKKEFILGVHYVKPTPKKLLFKWSAIVEWLEGGNTLIVAQKSPLEIHSASLLNTPPKNSINI